MKCLVTGASGFIGRNVLLRAPREWQIDAVYHQSTGLAAFVERHGLMNVRVHRADLTNPSDVAGLAGRAGDVDVCLHFAANGDPAMSTDRPRWDLTLNTVAFVTLLEQIRADRVVYVSSGAVYDGLKGPVSPASGVSPTLPYAIAKLASERYLQAFAERRRTVGSFANVRFFGAYGPYEPDRKITTRWMRAAMGGQTVFPVRGSGENLIDFMYVDDAVDGFLKIAMDRDFSGTIDFASGAPVTVNEVIRTMARSLNVDLTIEHQGHTEEYIEFWSVDTTMRDRFGFSPSVRFEDGIHRLKQFLRSEANVSRQLA